MGNYQLKAINYIAETFQRHSIKFYGLRHPDSEELLANFSVDCGPNVMLRFCSHDNENDVSIRIFGLISNIPPEKRFRILDACNVLNQKIRFIKFALDSDGNINVKYDFPVCSPDDAIGDMVLEVSIRMLQVLNAEYSIFMRALYTDDELYLPTEQIQKKLAQEIKALEERLDTQTAASEADSSVLAVEASEDL